MGGSVRSPKLGSTCGTINIGGLVFSFHPEHSLSTPAMETSLHQALKRRYGGKDDRFEAALGNYRIDVISQGHLVEIQLAPLAAIRDKVRTLLKDHHVVVVKPIIVQKTLVKRAKDHGPVVSRRRSPKRGTILDLFHEMVHFTGVFPHQRLTLEVPLIDIEEWRYPGTAAAGAGAGTTTGWKTKS